MIHAVIFAVTQAFILFFALRGAFFYWQTVAHPTGIALAFLAVPVLFAVSLLIADARYALVLPRKSLGN